MHYNSLNKNIFNFNNRRKSKLQFLTNTTKKAKEQIDNVVYGTMFATSLALSELTSSVGTAFADTKVSTNIPTVESDGSVTMKGNGGSGDPKQAVTKLFEQAQFISGVIAALAGIIIVCAGIWYGQKASRQTMEGNTQGYKNASNVALGAVIGGGLIAAIGLFLSVGAGFGLKLFG